MDNPIQDKLFHFEVQPPEASWGRIADALDDSSLSRSGERLAQFETSPAQQVWDKIATQLVEHTPAITVPFFRRYAKPVRYSGAAAAILVMVLLFNLLISKKTVSEIPGQRLVKKEVRPMDKRFNESAPSPVETPDQGDISFTETAPSESDRRYYIPSRRNFGQLRPLITGHSLSISDVVPQYAIRNTTIAFNEDADKYMPYYIEDGNAVKLPKRLYDAITCPNQDVTCLQKKKQIQEKMAASTLMVDFTGVLDMLNNLGENQ